MVVRSGAGCAKPPKPRGAVGEDWRREFTLGGVGEKPPCFAKGWAVRRRLGGGAGGAAQAGAGGGINAKGGLHQSYQFVFILMLVPIGIDDLPER